MRSTAGLLILAACARPAGDARGPVTIRFWAFGREGEVVQQLVPEFERRNPGVRVRVQQIPWSAAHEKLLTAYVGGSTPDVAQLGNTWVPELHALGALEPLGARAASSTAPKETFFPGIWETNVVDGEVYGVPWYVDTRVLFYRSDLLAAAGHATPPTTWAGWREAMRAMRARMTPAQYPILLPTNEWPQPAILGLQTGAPLLRDGDRYGGFRDPRFRQAFDFYVGLFRDSLAPSLSSTQISNRYQEFARGNIAMMITGPWEIGEFKRRLPPELQRSWMTAPLPGPTGPGVSMAGGASIVIFRDSPNRALAWKLLEFLAEPAQQLRFYQLTGNLPSRRDAWRDSSLAGDVHLRAFRDQLDRVRPLPKVPEWEQVATKLYEHGERAVRGRATVDQALASLDRDVDALLEKRRWMLARRAQREAVAAGAPAAGGR